MTNTEQVGAVAPGENADHFRGATKMVLPPPYGWVAAGKFYTIREQAIEAAGKTPCIDVYLRPQLLADEPDHVEHVRAMVPSVEQLAEALNDVRCFHDLSAELIAPQLRENLARMNHGPDHLRDAAKMVSAVEQSAMVVPEGWWQIIHDTLRNYRMSTLDDGHGDGYPLIDAMTADGQSVAGGIEECTYLADAIWNGLLAAAPTPETASPWISVEDRLPEPFTVVALMHDDRWMNTGAGDFQANWTAAGWLDDSFGRPHWSVIGEMRAQCLDAATHWMPLPSAPEQPAKEVQS